MALIAFDPAASDKAPPSAYYAIYASGFVAVVLLALIFDQLGVPAAKLTPWLVAFPAAAYVVAAVLGFGNDASSWFAAGREATPVLGAASALVSVLGGLGFVALPGAFFFLGFDALPFTSGIMLGLVLHAILIAPFARKDGSYSLAGFIGRRFESPLLRLCAAGALTLPCLLLLAGEFKLAGFLLGHATEHSPLAIVSGLAIAAALAVGIGGMRGIVYAGSTAAIVVFLVLGLPPAICGLLVINLPVPQLTYGLARSEMARLELVAGMDTHPAAAIVLTLPGAAPETLVKPFMQAFVADDRWSFTLLTISIALGVATMPSLFARAGTIRAAVPARRMSVWLVCLAGAVTLTLPAVAFITRLALLRALPESPVADLPGWLNSLHRLGLADFNGTAAGVPLSAVHFTRDSTGLLLPMVLGLPRPLADLALAVAAAVALAAISAEAMALAVMWCEDVAFAYAKPEASEGLRVTAGRGLAVAAVVLGAVVGLRMRADPLTLFAWAMALTGSSVFTLLVLSVWWKRITLQGALAGLLAGSLVAVAQILLSINGAVPILSGISGALASILAAPLGLAAAVGVSLVTPMPRSRLIETLREIRLSGGEIVRDREIRLARISDAPRA